MLAKKKSEILPLSTTQMDLKVWCLTEISETEINSFDLTYMWNLKNKTRTLTDTENKRWLPKGRWVGVEAK